MFELARANKSSPKQFGSVHGHQGLTWGPQVTRLTSFKGSVQRHQRVTARAKTTPEADFPLSFNLLLWQRWTPSGTILNGLTRCAEPLQQHVDAVDLPVCPLCRHCVCMPYVCRALTFQQSLDISSAGSIIPHFQQEQNRQRSAF